jgi:hypothetical protein
LHPSDKDGLAEMTFLATIANLQANLEILEVSKNILKSNIAHQQVLEEILKRDRKLYADT